MKNFLSRQANVSLEMWHDVMASISQYSEYEHLERILMDAVCTEPIPIEDEDFIQATDSEKYRKYQKGTYEPMPHTPRIDT